jgi:hypothetical protein
MRLTGEAPTKHVRSNKGGCIQSGDVVIARHSWEILLEDGAGVGVSLNLPNRFHSGALQAQLKAAYAGE